MDYKIVWSDAALADLDDICSAIARHNPSAASNVGRGILDHVRVLASFPYIGPVFPKRSQGPIHVVVYRPYRIFYSVSEETRSVEILNVWHGSREDPPL